MTYVQSLHGSGGWPLSAFLSPSLNPLMAGTYFPPEDMHGRIGFKTILRCVFLLTFLMSTISSCTYFIFTRTYFINNIAFAEKLTKLGRLNVRYLRRMEPMQLNSFQRHLPLFLSIVMYQTHLIRIH